MVNLEWPLFGEDGKGLVIFLTPLLFFTNTHKTISVRTLLMDMFHKLMGNSKPLGRDVHGESFDLKYTFQSNHNVV